MSPRVSIFGKYSRLIFDSVYCAGYSIIKVDHDTPSCALQNKEVMVSPAAPAPVTQSIPIEKGVKLSKLNNTNNKSVAVSAVSATLSMEPLPPPLPLPQSSDGPAARKGTRTNGASLSQPRNAPSPVILSIDASAQGETPRSDP